MPINWGELIKTAAPIAAGAMGKLAAGKTAGRAATNQHNTTSDQLRLGAQGQEEAALQGRGRLQIDQREEGRAALNDAYKNALRSAVAMNMQDSTVGGLPKGVPNISFSGGMRPSAMGAEGRAAAGAMNNSAMQSLLHPQSPMTLPGQSHFTPSRMQEAGGLENAMGIVGAAGGAYQQYKAQQDEDQQRSLVQDLLRAERQRQMAPAMGIGASDAPLGFPTA